MSLVLTHGYFLKEDPKEQAIMKPYPPLGILCISAYLNEQAIDNKLFDSTFSDPGSQLDFLKETKPKYIAFYCNLMTKLNVLRQVSRIKAIEELRSSKIIFGGPDVTYNAENYLQHGGDVVVIGEAEETMKELVTCGDWDEANLSNIDGIAFLNEEGKMLKTKPRVKVKSIDDLPQPNRAGIDMKPYLDTWNEHHGQSALNVSTQRGCPYTCKWCSTAVYGQSYRRRSPSNVVDELVEIQRLYSPDTIWFVDDVFTVSHKWLKAFVTELEDRDVHIKFECISRADRMNSEVIELLRRAGCFRIWIGAESGSQKIIDAMDRRVSVDKVREMIQETRKSGIEAGTFIMLGYPGETKEDIEETIHHLKVSNPDHFTITVAYPIKGTRLYEEVESSQITDLEWSESTDRDRDFVRTYPKKYYDHAVTKVVNEVRYFQSKNESGLNKQTIKYKIKSILSTFQMSLYARARNSK